MELKTEKEINNYIEAYKKLIAKNNSRPCIEFKVA